MTTPNTEAELSRAEMLIGLDRYAEAAQRAEGVLATEPDNPRAAALVAQAALELGDFYRAISMAREATKFAPEWWWPYYLQSYALSRVNNNDQALYAAHEAVRLEPGMFATHVCWGDALLNAGRVAEARAAAEEALKLAPNAVAPYYLAGRVARAENRKKDALAAFNRALSIDPDHAPTHNELARMQLGKRNRVMGFRAGALANAAGGFATAVRADPNNALVRRNLELTTLSFLRVTAYFVFIAGYFGNASAAGGKSSFEHHLPLILLLLPLGYGSRFLLRLRPDMRRYLRDLVLHRPAVRNPMVLLAVSVVLIVCEVFVNRSARLAFGSSAIALAFGSRLLLWHHRRQIKGG